MKIGITGGIGSGKSYICQRLKTRGIEVYDCDSAAKRLSEDTYIGDSLNKVAVARFLLASESNAQAIDHIVHPAVFQDFMDSGMQWMESAILYESGINKLVDRVIVVTAPLEIRIQRVMQRDGITRENVEQWMQRQWSQEEIRKQADYEIVNDGIADIDAQIDIILEKIKE